MKPIYKPKGAAKEYGDYALNIYTGCPHRCYYCFAPQVLHRDREQFHSYVEPRNNIVDETRKQLQRDKTLRGKLIHLCFTCDPYPRIDDTTTTREIIRLLKEYGNHVQILTKSDGKRDFDLLDENDWYGVSVSCNILMAGIKEPGASNPVWRMSCLKDAKEKGIGTWVSFEPILDTKVFFNYMKRYGEFIDKVKIGKLNYHPSDINWAQFGREAEALCKEMWIDYYIKDSLRKCMEVTPK